MVVYEVASIPEKFIMILKKEVTSHFFQTLQEHGYKSASLSRLFMLGWLRKNRQLLRSSAILGLTQISYFDDGTNSFLNM